MMSVDTRVPVAFKNFSTSLLTLGTLVPFSVIHLQPMEASAMHVVKHMHVGLYPLLPFIFSLPLSRSQ